MPTKKARELEFFNRMTIHGFTVEETMTLLRAERALHRWAEKECGDGNGCITRDDDTGKPFWQSSIGTNGRWPIRDQEAAAKRKIDAVLARHPSFRWYHQGDCRGCSVYLIPTDKYVPATIDSNYSSVGFPLYY